MPELQQQLFPEPEKQSEVGGVEVPFDWFDDNGDVVVESQSSIAVYRNRRNHVVIRAERQVEGDDDMFICLATAPALSGLIERLQRELREGF